MRTFLLSEAQKFFLRDLRQLHCVTEAQAWHLLVERFGVSENAVAPILRQLKTAGLVRRLDGVIVLDGSKPDPQRLMANELLLTVPADRCHRGSAAACCFFAHWSRG